MDMITIIAMTNGIQYLYKFIKVVNVYYSSVEIASKITLQQTVKHIDNVATIYDVGTFFLALNQPSSHVKKETPPKKKISNNNMGKMYRAVSEFFHNMYMCRLERAERQAEKRKELLYAEKMKRERNVDSEKEKELHEIGYLRDKTSRHYIRPDKMLMDIHIGVLKMMSGDKYSNDDRQAVKKLILEDAKLSDFEKYENLFYYVEVLDRVTKRPFVCELLEGEMVYSPNTIMYLQDKKRRLVYVNTAIIEFENRCVE